MSLRTKPGDSLLQNSQGHSIGVAYRQCKAVAIGQLFQAFDFSPDGSPREIAIVEKDIAARNRQVVTARHLFSHGTTVGAAIDEIHAIERTKHLHQPAHRLCLLRERTAHMVVHAFDPGEFSQGNQHGALKYQPIHPAIEHHRLQRPFPTLSFHWQMQHQLPVHGIEGSSQPFGFRGIRKNGEGHGWIQPCRFHAGSIVVADIVDDQCDHAGLCRRDGQQKNDSDAIELFHECFPPVIHVPPGIRWRTGYCQSIEIPDLAIMQWPDPQTG